MVFILFHDDWEIYGDGTGDPVKLMFDPAKQLLDICDTYGAKYTFYAEIGQQLHMLDASAPIWREYAQTWEEVLKDAIVRGHDVQLHFHPQWIGAKLQNNTWKLDYRKWNTGSLSFDLLDEWIGKGTAYIRNLLNPVQSDYELLSYRAGGWMCQPSTNIYKTLKNHGIVCDASVLKGRYKKFEGGGYIDFRHAPSQFEPWEVNPDDFARLKPGSDLWELPVYTETSKLAHPAYLLSKSFAPLYYFNIFKKRRSQKNGGAYTPKAIESGKHKDYYGSFGYMHYKHLLSYTDRVKINASNTGKSKHLIFLTHSKSFLDYKNFETFLCLLSKQDAVVFSTTRNYINNHLIK